MPISTFPLPTCPPPTENLGGLFTQPPQRPNNQASSVYSMDEFGYGRLAKSMDPLLAQLLLKKFANKYPLTGTMSQTVMVEEVEEEEGCSSGFVTPSGPGILTPQTTEACESSEEEEGVYEIPHPAVIQQRLEELLLKKKEKQVYRKLRMLMDGISEDSGVSA